MVAPPVPVKRMTTGESIVKDQISPEMEVELRDVGFLDEVSYANSRQCTKRLGDIMTRLPKRVLEMTKE